MTELVPRPNKRDEYLIYFASKAAEKGWRDCLSQFRSATTDCYDQLTRDPLRQSYDQYQLSADLSTALHEGVAYEQWQYKISDGARVRYLVDKRPVLNARGKQTAMGRVIIRAVDPGHPKDTQ